MIQAMLGLDELYIAARTFQNSGVRAFSEDPNPSNHLSPTNTYLSPSSSNVNCDSVWNGETFRLNTLMDILDYLDARCESSITIREYQYTSQGVIDDLTNRISQIFSIMLDPLQDDIRGTQMVGLSQVFPISSNTALSGKRFFHQFHAFAPLEPIARFAQYLKKHYLLVPWNDLVSNLGAVYDAYEPDWDGTCYEDPHETAHGIANKGPSFEPPAYLAYNMAATVGMALWWMFQASGDGRYLKRSIDIATFCETPFDPLGDWHYSDQYDRTEDPDHGMEVLRFAVHMEERGYFSHNVFEDLLFNWFSFGISEDKDFFMDRIVSFSTQTSQTTQSVASRALFLFKKDSYLFRKVL